MTKPILDRAEKAARELIRRIEAVREEAKTNYPSRKPHAALKRHSMELTNVMVELRKTGAF